MLFKKTEMQIISLSYKTDPSILFGAKIGRKKHTRGKITEESRL